MSVPAPLPPVPGHAPDREGPALPVVRPLGLEVGPHGIELVEDDGDILPGRGCLPYGRPLRLGNPVRIEPGESGGGIPPFIPGTRLRMGQYFATTLPVSHFRDSIGEEGATPLGG